MTPAEVWIITERIRQPWIVQGEVGDWREEVLAVYADEHAARARVEHYRGQDNPLERFVKAERWGVVGADERGEPRS